MAGPIDKTMQVLASTANAQALEVLVAALDVAHEHIQSTAVTALIKRNSSRGQLEVIRRLTRFSDKVRSSVESQVGRLSDALRQALLHGDSEMRTNGLELVRSAEDFSQLPVLLEMLKDGPIETTNLAADSLRDLVDRLYEHCQTGNASRSPTRYLRNAPQVKHKVLSNFDRALLHFAGLSHQREIVEAVLILGEADNFAIKRLLTQGGVECRQLTSSLLMTSKHPGVMELVLEYMSRNYPPPQIFEVIAQRDDPEFIAHLLHNFPKNLTAAHQKNYRQIESVAWLSGSTLLLEEIPPSLQEKVVQFVSATGLPANVKLSVQEWVVRHGPPEGRLAAADVFSAMGDDTVQSIISNSLNSDDEDIQAWATSQLRSQGISEALPLLIERLDSPLPTVRDAAREELQSFNVTSMIEMFEELDPAVCLNAGKLIAKIDPNCFDKLRLELASPIRRKRIRAARAAGMMGMQVEVLSSLVAMLEDSDPLVRRTGIETLSQVHNNESIHSISQLLEDVNPRVRDAAARALDDLRVVT